MFQQHERGTSDYFSSVESMYGKANDHSIAANSPAEEAQVFQTIDKPLNVEFQSGTH